MTGTSAVRRQVYKRRDEVIGLPPTPRQIEVGVLLTEGLSEKEIATKLDLSVKTVSVHKQELMRRIGARTSAQAVYRLVTKGIIPIPTTQAAVERLCGDLLTEALLSMRTHVIEAITARMEAR